ncbi:hypothetical protein L6164_002355 [Bauhinia variegata]|uniref:Uncharacterized protein n=1 Tax=Bauhinia variegata TaxID=167791 RepID=A0ACB9Q034_BAUVA|nr:hypothetical protein L6164_002355 [Bauhinia variegata]
MNPTSSAGSSSKVTKSKGKKSGKKGKGMKLSTDPQSVAARERRHRISDRFKILQSMVPGGNKMDTVSMLEEAIQYVKFLKTQIWLHQTMINYVDDECSPMFIPEYLHAHQENSLQIPLNSSIDNSLQNFPQLPLTQSRFHSEATTFDANINKYWPA